MNTFILFITLIQFIITDKTLKYSYHLNYGKYCINIAIVNESISIPYLLPIDISTNNSIFELLESTPSEYIGNTIYLTQSYLKYIPVQILSKQISLFEMSSALGGTGLSLGATSSNTFNSKILVIIYMFAGRIGPLTLFLFLMQKEKQSHLKYLEEKVIIG